MAAHPTPLKFVGPPWFAVVMGLCGLALAWHRAVPLMGDMAGAAALVIGALAALVLVALAAATVLRRQRYPEAWAEDLRHPVRHPFVAALPISVLLLATVSVATRGPDLAGQVLWWAGSLLQLWVTVWVLSKWWRGNVAGGLQWATVTPALFIPIVGNVLVPLAGVPLGHADWSAAQMGIGLMFWPVVLVMLLVRVAVAGLWPERLRPAVFILIAPPAVVGLALLQLGAPLGVAWAMWGMALFSFLWAGSQGKAIAGQPFALPHWAMSFPLAAFAALTLRLATPGSPLAVLGPVLLALATLVICVLLLATVRGLRDGSLLAPEPVATLQVAPG
jgi:tellurite resistance protein